VEAYKKKKEGKTEVRRKDFKADNEVRRRPWRY
jgi:hypothetical protein